MSRLIPEKPDVNPDYPMPVVPLNEWQIGLMRMLGDIEPQHWFMLWKMAEEVSPHGTSWAKAHTLSYFFGYRYSPVTKQLIADGWLTLKKQKQFIRKKNLPYTTYHYILNPCIKRGLKPKGWQLKLKHVKKHPPWETAKRFFLSRYYMTERNRKKPPYYHSRIRAGRREAKRSMIAKNKIRQESLRKYRESLKEKPPAKGA